MFGLHSAKFSRFLHITFFIYKDFTYLEFAQQWDLVCDRASFLELSQTALIIGVTIGSVTFGFLADRFGRKRVFFMSLFAQGLLGCIEASVSSIEVFIIVRLFIGIVDQVEIILLFKFLIFCLTFFGIV